MGTLEGTRGTQRPAAQAATPRSLVTHVLKDGSTSLRAEHLIAEEPLTVAVATPSSEPSVLTTTLRTPGEDVALAVGLVVTELSAHPEDLVGVSLCPPPRASQAAYRQATVVLRRVTRPLESPALRTSSCGWCGTEELDARLRVAARPTATVELSELFALQEMLEGIDQRFRLTRASHSAVLARRGTLLAWGEDVGRHNALDKAVGRCVLDHIDLDGADVMLSGRVGTDLVVKAASFRARSIVAYGAPSARAAATARHAGIVLAGVARSDELRLYANEGAVLVGGRRLATLQRRAP